MSKCAKISRAKEEGRRNNSTGISLISYQLPFSCFHSHTHTYDRNCFSAVLSIRYSCCFRHNLLFSCDRFAFLGILFLFGKMWSCFTMLTMPILVGILLYVFIFMYACLCCCLDAFWFATCSVYKVKCTGIMYWNFSLCAFSLENKTNNKSSLHNFGKHSIGIQIGKTDFE